MILLELEIEDYKQFAGIHRFTPAPEGIIAIIGHNGAGKTTLFEAIEWCLYQPREIAADEVAPRGQVAKPRVKLTLMDPESGNRYVIVRSLSRSRVADAEIYREDSAESRIVKGSRQCTEYVSRTLIGLSHRAFVSTFFTRQKELTFFGDLKETDRRREVGRLLGMETIREAQKLIGDERAELLSQAKALELQHRETTEGRDFALEADTADKAVDEQSATVAAAFARLSGAEKAHTTTRAELERLTALERREAETRRQLERIDGDIRAAQERRTGAVTALQRIDEVGQERAELEKVAAELDARRLALRTQELTREQFQSRQRIESDHTRVRKAIADTIVEMRTLIQNNTTTLLPAWRWNDDDDHTPLPAAERLIGVAANIDLETASARLTALETVARLSAEHEKTVQSLSTMQAFLDRLKLELSELLKTGNPVEQMDTLSREREQSLKYVHETGSRLNAIAEEIARLEPVLGRLRAQEAGTTCPTCGRPIVADDIAVTLDVFADQIRILENERGELNRQRPNRLARIAAIEAERETLKKRSSEIDILRGRIDTGNQRISDSQGERDTKAAALKDLLASHRIFDVPTAPQLARESTNLDALRRVSGALPLLRRLARALLQSSEDEINLQANLTALGVIAYDPAAHKLAQEALSSADRAGARLSQIDALLLQRPEHVAEIAAADGLIATLSTERTAHQLDRQSIGFEPARLALLQQAEQSAILAERAARDHSAAATSAHLQATTARDALLEEHRRILRLIERSEARTREAGQLDLMYREFNAFEQFVADRLTPQLSEYTSDLLRAITDGKYDQVWFNSNYGIEVFDGDEEHFPVDEFSGGERDVIALCARLALSRLIGTQANNPPGFMVLDEVFGSLDRERRAQVLETMGALAGTADAFHQLFIISHVDDVRSSPIFNEVWRVSEGADGVSMLENLNLTGGFDDS